MTDGPGMVGLSRALLCTWAVAAASCGGGGGGGAGEPSPPAPPPSVPAAVAIVVDDVVRVGQPVWFKTNLGLARDFSVSWNFGDGAPRSDAAAWKAYTAAGPTTVTVTVGDRHGGSVSASRRIEVVRAADPPPALCTGRWCLLPAGEDSLDTPPVFANEQLGYMLVPEPFPVDATTRGVIHVTRNGGQSWAPSTLPSVMDSFPFVVDRVAVASAEVAYLYSSRYMTGRGLRTADAGRSWQSFEMPPGAWTAMGSRSQVLTLGSTSMVMSADFNLRGLPGPAWSYGSDDAGRSWIVLPPSLLRVRTAGGAVLCRDGQLRRYRSAADPGEAVETPVACRTVTSDGARALVVVGADGASYTSLDDGRSWAMVASTAANAPAPVTVTAVHTGTLWGVRSVPPAVEPIPVRSSDNGQTWRQVVRPGGAGGSVHALDADAAWTGEGRVMHITLDAGVSWRRIDLPGDLAQGPTVDAGGAWVMTVRRDGGASQVLRSLDGGLTWRVVWQDAERAGQDPLVMLDRERGIVLRGRGVALSTADGGASWAATRYAPSPTAAGAQRKALALQPGGIVWSIDGGQAWRSSDAGRSWQQLQLPPGLAGRLHRLSWTTATEGLALALACDDLGIGCDEQRHTLWLTRDGGQTWQALAAAGSEVVLAAGPSEGQVVLVRSDGTVWRSVDRGATWARASTPTPPFQGALPGTLQFIAGGQGWMLVGGLQLWRSSDAGASWQAVALPLPAAPGPESPRLFDLRFADALRGYAVGSHGTILSSNDGGLSWVREPAAVRATALLLHLTVLADGSVWVPADRGVLRALGR